MAVRLEALSHRGQAALPDLRAAAAGRIVTVASTAGVKGYPFVAAYVAAKPGAVGLTRALAPELAGPPLTLTAVCPGIPATPTFPPSVSDLNAKHGPPEREHSAHTAQLTHPSRAKTE